jgi:hypothetical protein
VSAHEVDEVDGRTRVTLDATAADDLRPKIFEVAKSSDWTLWELHRERASLEQVFRNLTVDRVGEDDPVAEADDDPGEAEPAEVAEEAPSPEVDDDGGES